MLDRALEAASLHARIERLPWSRPFSRIVARLSVGAFFDIYEVALTGLSGPMLTKAGLFRREGVFGVPDLATFAFATFAGLFVGVLVSAACADRYGRRPVLTASPLIYGLATLVMAMQDTVFGICLWRSIAAIGVGMEVVAVDAYLAEIVPRAARGRGFALGKSIQYSAAPTAMALAALASAWVANGLWAWRLLLLVPVLGAPSVWWVRRSLPESPRWLVLHGRVERAARIVTNLEDAVRRTGRALPSMEPPTPDRLHWSGADLFRRPLRRRMVMMLVAGCASSIAYYGFGNWLPTMIEARGVAVTRSLAYTAVIACAYPLSPLCFTLFADRTERKWQIVAGAAMVGSFGLAFADQTSAAGWIGCGVLVSVANNLVAYASHTYRSELFPTELRARAIGATYSVDRLVAAFASYLFGWLLMRLGVGGVVMAIAGAALLDMTVIGLFGPRTRRLTGETAIAKRETGGPSVQATSLRNGLADADGSQPLAVMVASGPSHADVSSIAEQP